MEHIDLAMLAFHNVLLLPNIYDMRLRIADMT